MRSPWSSLPIAAMALGLGLMPITPLQAQWLIGGKTLVRGDNVQAASEPWVFYEKGAPQTAAHRLQLTSKVRVQGSNIDPALLKQRAAASQVRRVGDSWIVEFSGPEACLNGAKQLAKLASVQSAEPMFARQLQPRLLPNDPLFANDPKQPGYQWHLRNTGARDGKSGIDLNVTTVWDNRLGGGVVIGIVDDGLQIAHPDLAPNINRSLQRDFNEGDDDPSPGPDNPHGTSCAGVAAARGNNGIGGSGVAPMATLAGLRLIAAPTDDEDEAAAIAWRNDSIHIKSNSWGPGDDAYGAHGPGPLAARAITDAITTGRGGRGTIFLWAGGNGNGSGDDSNYDGWANTPAVIAVGALGDDEREAPYSEPGSNLLVCAPSNGGKQGITTADLIGGQGYSANEYTSDFGGTSSATPAVAGVVALMLQANPNLGWRDVQEILVRTARRIDAFSGDWTRNSAGLFFHHDYGAGLVNAQAAVNLAATWVNLAPVVTRSLNAVVRANIPDKGQGKLARSVTVGSADNLRLEHVQVHVRALHPYRGQLEWWLVSPSGVRSRLARARGLDTGANLDWTFCTTHHWGEWSQGQWTLEVEDRGLSDTGELMEFSLIFHGTALPNPSLPAPVVTSGLVIGDQDNPPQPRLLIVGREDGELRHQITAAHGPTQFESGPAGMPPGLTLNSSSGLITGTPNLALMYGQVYPTSLVVTNGTGQAVEEVLFYFLTANNLLGDALDQPRSTRIVPFGYADWYSQATDTKDGQDAARSGDVDDRDYSGMEFSVSGPATLSFQWKVSSEQDYDYLVLVIDDEVEELISGETDWKEVRRDLPAGRHQVDIYYLKDEASSEGLDAGLVDQMTLTPINTAPVVQAATVRSHDSALLRHEVQATQAPGNWSATGLPTGVLLDPNTGILHGRCGTPGTHLINVTASNPFGSGSAIITLIIESQTQGLARALESTGSLAAELQTSGDGLWYGQNFYTMDGGHAARSGNLGDLQQCSMSCEVQGPGKLEFFWAVSSEEDCDFLTFEINGETQQRISGEQGWRRQTYLLGAGTHLLRWTYSKDNYVKAGLDSGFVDALSLSVDQDQDGRWSDEEAAFGSSDLDAESQPRVELLMGADGSRQLQFSSIAGRSYEVRYGSGRRFTKRAELVADSALTRWTDPTPLGQTEGLQLYWVVALPPPSDP